MLLGASLLFAGCTHDFDEPALSVPTPESKIAINIDGSIAQVYTTRVDDGGFCDGDQIGIFGVNYTDNNSSAGELINSGNQVDNARYTFDEANWTWTSNGSIYYKDAETNIDLYGYYPYASVDNVSAYQFEVAQDQSGETLFDGYAQSDFLWGKAENIAPSDTKVKLRFNHMMASLNVVLTEGDGFAEGEFESLKKSVMAMNTIRTAEIDLATGKVTPVGSVDSEGIVMKGNAEGFRAVIVPQCVKAGTTLLSFSIDGISYRYKNSSKDINYLSGMQTNMTIKAKKKSHQGSYEFELVSCEIVDWVADLDAHGGEARQYYVVHLDEAGTLERKIKEAGKNPAKIKNLKVSGRICEGDFYFMRDKMEILQAVNLKECEVVEAWCYNIQFSGEEWQNVYFDGIAPTTKDERDAIVYLHYPDKKISTWGGYRQLPANEIPNSAFNGKSYLTFFCFPEHITKIGDYAFSNTLLSGALIIPDDVVEIGAHAFYETNISSLKLSNNIRSIDVYAFCWCSSLSGELLLPESLESIGSDCFANCAMLTGTLTLPSKLKTISSNCFEHCSGFTGDLIIPESVTKIGSFAFGYCSGFNGTLTLPKGLKEIGDYAFLMCNFQGELLIPYQVKEIPESSFAHNRFSSIKFAENSELIAITGTNYGAFGGNSRLSEPIELPDGVMTIQKAFSYCSNLPAIVLPKSLTVIGQSTFLNCYNLTAITCKATTPPICGSGAFDGVPKDNFTVEVPAQSIVKYQTASGWGDFKRIGAHYDFSISRSKIRALNAEHSRELLLRAPAGNEWRVESAPEWVTITPMSGIGKQDVVVTINAMSDAEVGTFETAIGNNSNGTVKYEKNNGRIGEVVFLLNGKDYRARLVVEQYDADNYDGEVIVNQTASVGNGVNIVFMGDCFDARDIAHGSYNASVNEAIGYYFAIEPYKTYRDYFNVYTVVGMSNDSGMGTVNTIKDAKFGSQYSLSGITPDMQTTYEYAMKADGITEDNLNQTLVVLIENTTDYGGICYMWGDGSAIAVCPMSADAYPFDFRGIVQHEAGGHGFAKLGDEYIYTNGFIASCECLNPHLDSFRAGKSLGWYRNLSESGDMKNVEWAHLIYHPDYSNIVDMYEGGYFHTRGIFRSEAVSCMNNNIPYYSAISRQEMVERIKQYAGEKFDIDDFYARDVRDASNNTRATIFEPSVVISDAGVGKQMPPKYMGNKPQLKKSNK